MALLGMGNDPYNQPAKEGRPGSGSWFGSTQHDDADEGPLPCTIALRGGPVSSISASVIYLDTGMVQVKDICRFQSSVNCLVDCSGSRKRKSQRFGIRGFCILCCCSQGASTAGEAFNIQVDRCSYTGDIN